MQQQDGDNMNNYNKLYEMYDTAAYMLQPIRKVAQAFRSTMRANPLFMEYGIGRFLEGVADTYERSTRYLITPPEFNINSVMKDGKEVQVFQTTVLKKPFARLVHFHKANQDPNEPKVLIISPISGHFATLQRDTVKRMVPNHDVYITDWISMREVPVSEGDFDLDAYLTYLIDFMHYIGSNTHVMAICQPSVQVVALAALMEEANDPCSPASIIPMGGPIDPRANKTEVNELAETHPLSWFADNFLTPVPEGHPGAGRLVYPGFIQITAFINMNPDSHFKKHVQFLVDKINNNQTAVDKHATFYDEYLSLLDMDAPYYLQTVEKIFQTYELPRGLMKYKGHRIDLNAIHSCALMTIEGENDDISAPGQSYAAHAMCKNIPNDRRAHHLQPGVGHYGVFSGSKWRAFVAPKIEEFIQKIEKNPYKAPHNKKK